MIWLFIECPLAFGETPATQKTDDCGNINGKQKLLVLDTRRKEMTAHAIAPLAKQCSCACRANRNCVSDVINKSEIGKCLDRLAVRNNKPRV